MGVVEEELGRTIIRSNNPRNASEIEKWESKVLAAYRRQLVSPPGPYPCTLRHLLSLL